MTTKHLTDEQPACAFCKTEWRPMNIHTVGVRELP
jgi:hypothetical protein